jgi:hypothetical protein
MKFMPRGVIYQVKSASLMIPADPAREPADFRCRNCSHLVGILATLQLFYTGYISLRVTFFTRENELASDANAEQGGEILARGRFARLFKNDRNLATRTALTIIIILKLETRHRSGTDMPNCWRQRTRLQLFYVILIKVNNMCASIHFQPVQREEKLGHLFFL